MSKVFLKKGEGRTLRDGGCWIFDNEIAKIEGEYENGDIVTIYSDNGYFLAKGYINNNSKIIIRTLTRDENEEVNDDLFYDRLKQAYEYRKRVMDISSCRLVFSEADRLPGLVIDKFSDVLVLQADTLGIDIRKKMLAEMMMKILKDDGIDIKGVFERSDARVRLLEGLERIKGYLIGEFDTNVIIKENDILMSVDIKEGQKTGYFLDQKFNRLAIRNICRDAKVLDCCTHTGSFALNAATVAKSVKAIDYSSLAIEKAKENAKLNGFNNIEFEVHDIFDYLPELMKKGEKFDVIILDPPAFTKSSSSLKNAAKGYKEINYRAMKLLNPGGFLVTCSCSEYMQRDHFINIILQAGNDAHKRLKLVESRSASYDHPVIIGNNVSDYLKCVIVQVNDR